MKMIGPAIKQVMQENGCSPSLLAMHFMVTQPAISKLRSAEANPNYSTLQKIAKKLGVTVSYIVQVAEQLEKEKYK